MNIGKYFSRDSLFSAALWLAAIVLFIVFLSAVDYTFRDPDSQLYSKLGQELSAQSLSKWIAPRWVAYSGTEAYFREHPPGALWVNAALIRLGVPPGQSSATANFIYFLITFLFVFKLGTHFKDKTTGWGVCWAVFLIPVTFQYIVRGNLEPPLTMATIAGMYALVKTREHFGYTLLFALTLIFSVFVKGMQGAFVGVVGTIFWLLVSRDKKTFYALAASAVTLVSVMILYDWIYHIQTGEEFWLSNFKTQAVNAVETNALLQKPYNFIWYLARGVYFTLPWSIFLLLGLRNKSERAQLPGDKRWLWLLISAVFLIIVMSLFDRRADRYIFPAYVLISISAGWYVAERFEKIREWLKSDSKKQQLVFAVSILGVAVIKVIISMNFYSNVQFWRN